MASFPALPSGNNPYIGAAEGYAGASASAYNSLQTRIAEAARQEDTLKQQKAAAAATQGRADDTAYYRALDQGWLEVPKAQQTPPPAPEGRPTLQTSSQPDDTPLPMVYDRKPAPVTPPQIDPSRIKQIGGRQMYKLNDLETHKAFIPAGTLGEKLKEAGWDGETPITPEQSHNILQALNEAQPKDEPSEYDASGKYIDAKTGKPVSGFVGKKTKKFYPIDLSGGAGDQQTQAPQPGGGQQAQPPAGGWAPFNGTGAGERVSPQTPQPAQPAQTGGGNAYEFAPKEKTPKSAEIVKETNDAGDTTSYALDKDTGARLWTHVEKGVGARRKDPADPNAPARSKPPSAANLRVIVQNKAKALAAAQKAWVQDMEMAPKEASGESADKLRQTANENLRNAQQQAQLTYEEQLSDATGQPVAHNNWADEKGVSPVKPKAAAAAAGAASAPAPAQAPAKPSAAPAAQPAPAARAAAGPQLPEGAIIRNPKTGERRILRGGKWQPAP